VAHKQDRYRVRFEAAKELALLQGGAAEYAYSRIKDVVRDKITAYGYKTTKLTEIRDAIASGKIKLRDELKGCDEHFNVLTGAKHSHNIHGRYSVDSILELLFEDEGINEVVCGPKWDYEEACYRRAIDCLDEVVFLNNDNAPAIRNVIRDFEQWDGPPARK